MKKLIIYICLLLPVVAFQSCKKAYSPGDNYDFSNPLPPYAALKSTATIKIPTPQADTLVAVPFLIRTALQQAVTITYSTTGAVVLTNKTVTIPRDATTATASIPIPQGTTATTTVTLVSAAAADGTKFAIGADNVAANQKLNITVTP